MEDLKDIDTLLFSGGAMKCVSILGSLQYLFEENIVQPSFEGVRDIYFVSGSSIYITPLLIGLSMECTIELFKKIDYQGIYENSPERYFTTTGAILKERVNDELLLKDTYRS